MRAGRRITVNLSPRGDQALTDCQRVTGDNLTDVISNALRLYARVLTSGDDVFLKNEAGELERVHLP